MWGSREKKLGQKVNENFFQGRPRKKESKKVKKISFYGSGYFEKLKPNLGGLAIFHTFPICERVWKIAQPLKFGFISQNRGSQKCLRCSCLAQSQLCILEWSN